VAGGYFFYLEKVQECLHFSNHLHGWRKGVEAIIVM
jgi:hypothetical protein